MHSRFREKLLYFWRKISVSIGTRGSGHLFASLTRDLSGIQSAHRCLLVFTFKFCKCFNSCDVNQVSNSARDWFCCGVYHRDETFFENTFYKNRFHWSNNHPPSKQNDKTLVIKCDATISKLSSHVYLFYQFTPYLIIILRIALYFCIIFVETRI